MWRVVFGMATGNLAAAAFVSNAGGNATNGTQRILFDSSTGDLFYDADGNGATAKVLFAHLTLSGMSGTFGADDFLII